MSHINQLERIIQDREIQLFRQDLGYAYLGNLHDQANKNIFAVGRGCLAVGVAVSLGR